MAWRPIFAAFLALLLMAANSLAASGKGSASQNGKPSRETRLPSRLSKLGLEQLMNIKVTSVSRTRSTVGESAAAVYVITQEDIRRSGATTIAELLRRVPGMDVARIDNNTWAISSRGFNGQYADKLLVLVDGRSVYNPLFSGVFWDDLAYPLDDIERIEVIRGPGASVWGANAVNGVVNIITKSSEDTQGGLLSAGGGDPDLGFGTLQYGGKLAGNAWYRVYGEGFDRLKDQFSEGPINDKWYVGDIGARFDLKPDRKDKLFFDVQYIHSRNGVSYLFPKLAPPFTFRDLDYQNADTGHVMGRWTRTESKDSSLSLQLYWNHYQQDIENLQDTILWDSYDLDFHQNFPLGQRHEILYGFGYRLTDSFFSKSEADNGFIFSWDRPRRTTQLFSGFVQDQIALIKNRFSILLGTKIEHNDFTGFEVQPTGRLLWTPTKWQSAWFAVSRAVRTPSLSEESILLTLAPVSTSPAVVFPRLTFNTSMESEEVIAYELGYREQPSTKMSVDLAMFYNDYHRLRIGVFGDPTRGPDGSLILPLIIENSMKGDTYGAELAADWRPFNFWRLYAAYSFLKMELRADASLPPAIITAAEATQGQSPRNQVYIQSSWDLGARVDFDLAGRYVSRLTGFDPGGAPGVPNEVGSYIAADARLAWRPLKNLELSVVGKNLFDNHHPEFISSPQGQILGSPVVEIRRSVYGMVKWNF